MSGSAAPLTVVWALATLPGMLGPAGWRALSEAAAVGLDDSAVAAGWPALLAAGGVAVNACGSEAVADLLARAAAAVVLSVAEPTAAGSPCWLEVAAGSAAVRHVRTPGVVGLGLLEAARVMDRLRSPGGCPWDAAQTHESLTGYLLEEAHETVAAIQEGDLGEGLAEELGDLLLQVLFHARIADTFDIDGVALGLVEKMRRRHPHVFAGTPAGDAAALDASWEAIKAIEKRRRSPVEGVPLGQPALALLAQLARRARRAAAGEVPVPTGPHRELVARLVADVLAAVEAGVDPEAELRRVAHQFARRLAGAGLAAGDGAGPGQR